MALIYRHWFPCTVTAENPHGKGYTGYTYKTLEERDKRRFAATAVNDSVGLKRAITKYTKEKMQTDIIESDILPIHEVVIEREIYWIAYFDDFHNGYNRTKGGDGVLGYVPSAETRQKLSEAVGKRIEDGTHNFLDSEFQRRNVLKRIENGTHHFFDSEFQREVARRPRRKRVENGTHHFLRKNSHNARPEYYEAYWDFILLSPLGIKEVRKHLREKFSHIPKRTRNRWIREWQNE